MSKHQPNPQEVVFSNLSNTVPLRIAQLSDLLLDITGGWPKAVGGVLSYPQGDGLGQLTNEAQLFAWVDRHARVVWSRQGVSKKEFFEGLRQTAQPFRWATPYPHYPPLPGVLYLRQPPAPKKTGRLDELIGRFNPTTPLDAQLLKAAFVTPAAGLPPGRRPAMVFTSAAGGKPDPGRGRGTGKSTSVSAVGLLYGGTFGVRSNSNPDRTMAHARGARYEPAGELPPAARAAARSALAAAGLLDSFGCVDLLPAPAGGWLVLEVGTDGLTSHVDRDLGLPALERELRRRVAEAFWARAGERPWGGGPWRPRSEAG